MNVTLNFLISNERRVYADNNLLHIPDELKTCYFWSCHFPILAIILIINLTLSNFSATLTSFLL